jgi:prevent-host-death family protein
VTTLAPVTEIPRGEFVEHPDEILRRAEAGEDLVITSEGKPVVDLHPHRPPVSLEEFLRWPKADKSLLDDIRELRGGETIDESQDPWERWA